jgi:branched-chain amino acid transport system substrate-binding protein
VAALSLIAIGLVACAPAAAPSPTAAPAKPAEAAKPAATTAPAKPAEAKPAEAKPAEAKPAEAKPAATAAPAKPEAKPAAGGPDIKVGSTFVMSGGQAEYSQKYLVAGMQLAIEEANAAGGVNGRKIVAVLEDSRGEPGAAVAAMRKLVEVDKVPTLQTIYTPIAFAQGPIAAETKTVLWAPSVEHPELTSRFEWTARAAANSVQQGLFMADVLYKTMNAKKVAIIHEDQEAVNLEAKEFRNKFLNDLKGEILGEEVYKAGDTDFRNQLTKLRATNAEGLWVVGASPVEKPRVIKQVREMGWDVKILTHAPFETEETMRIGGTALNGVLYSATAVSKAYEDKFKARYGYTPDVNAAKHYDGMAIAIQAMKTGGVTGEQMLKAMNDIKEFNGAQGPLTNSGKREWTPGQLVKQVKDGQFVDYQQ